MTVLLGLLASPLGRSAALILAALALAGGSISRDAWKAGRPVWRRENAMCFPRSNARGARGLMLIGAMLTTAGCATTTPSAATRGACGAFAPINWAIEDTDPTIRQVKAHNAVGRELCGWRGRG
ncbi:hypothetical protein ACFSKM_17795 [Ancylobacter dichloromethanicus]